MDKFLIVVGLLLGALVVSFLISLPVYLLWNSCLVGAIDGVKEITWMQAWGINLLVGLMVQTKVETKAK